MKKICTILVVLFLIVVIAYFLFYERKDHSSVNEWVISDPLITDYSYLNYINDDTSPLDELYIKVNDGYLLKSVSFDSNGDRVMDKEIIFSNDPLNKSPERIIDIPYNSSNLLLPKEEMKSRLKKILNKYFYERAFLQPDKISSATFARYDTPEYKNAVKCIQKIKGRKNKGTPI